MIPQLNSSILEKVIFNLVKKLTGATFFKFNFLSWGQLGSHSTDNIFILYSKCYRVMSIFWQLYVCTYRLNVQWKSFERSVAYMYYLGVIFQVAICMILLLSPFGKEKILLFPWKVNWNFLGGWGGGCKTNFLGGGVWVFSGTAH